MPRKSAYNATCLGSVFFVCVLVPLILYLGVFAGPSPTAAARSRRSTTIGGKALRIPEGARSGIEHATVLTDAVNSGHNSNLLAAARFRSATTIGDKALKIPEGAQIGIEQATVLMEAVASRQKSNLLVFGVGNDSPMWMKATGGRVWFIEDDNPATKAGVQWFDAITRANPGINVVKVHYSTHTVESFVKYLGVGYVESDRSTYKSLRRQPFKESFFADLDLRSQLPDEVANTRWDVIHVDAPLGCCRTGPGRYQSLFTAWAMAASYEDGRPTHVFVDDFERRVEGQFGRVLFGDPVGVTHRYGKGANSQAHFVVGRDKLLSLAAGE